MTLQLLPVIGLLVSATRDRTIWKISTFSDNVFVLAMVVCPCILVYIFYFSVKLQLTNNRIWETIIYEYDLTVPEGLQFLRFFTISFCLDSRLKYLCICFLRNFFKCHEIIHFSKLSHIYFTFFVFVEIIHKNEQNFIPTKSRKNSKVIILTHKDLF